MSAMKTWIQPLTQCGLAAVLLMPSAVLAAETVPDGTSDVVSGNAESSLAAVDDAENAPLLTAEDADRARNSGAAADASSAEAAAEAAGDDGAGDAAPTSSASERRAKIRAERGRIRQERVQLREERRRAREEERQRIREERARHARTYGGKVRLELGLGWGVGAVEYSGSARDSDGDSRWESPGTHGFGGFIDFKFRPNARVPLMMGMDLAANYHPWLSGRSSRYTVDGIAEFAGNVIMDFYAMPNLYFQLGVGIGGMTLGYKSESDCTQVGVNGQVGIGMEFPVVSAFRMGLQLRAQGGAYNGDMRGTIGAHLVFSFL